jgi:hypothetical protein
MRQKRQRLQRSPRNPVSQFTQKITMACYRVHACTRVPGTGTVVARGTRRTVVTVMAKNEFERTQDLN